MIAFIDDDKILREITSEILNTFGFPNKTFVDSKSAIDWLEHYQACNLIITDLHMKNGSGVDVLNWALEHRPKIPVIFISGDEAALLHETEQFGEILKIPVLIKPFTTQELISKVKLAIESFERQQVAS